MVALDCLCTRDTPGSLLDRTSCPCSLFLMLIT